MHSFQKITSKNSGFFKGDDLDCYTNYAVKVKLLQELRFETATGKIKASPDGEFLIASGIYPPQVKVYDLRQLSLKFERHLISEIINFEILGDDYSKLAFLCADRSVILHAKYGSHYSLRIPRMGRDIIYDSCSCDLLCAASSSDLYRINLDQGRFLSPLSTQSPALNVVSQSKFHGLVACGGDDGAVECFDIRARSSIGRINTGLSSGDRDAEVTALEFENECGFLMAVGSSEGKVLIYDLRSTHPLRIKDHMYGVPIIDIKWHQSLDSECTKLITSDSHIVRIWDPLTGEGLTSIEPAGKINSTYVFSGSGLMLLGLDNSMEIPSYFIPALGRAPKWCPHLENLTEDMMEAKGKTSIYENFKFLTREELERLNLSNLIGTDLLKAYMHGFFIDYNSYTKAKSLAEPFAYSSYIEQRKRAKMEAERSSRITMVRKLPKVNRKLASRLLMAEEIEENEKKDTGDVSVKSTKKKKKLLNSELLKDERFAEMFTNEDFEIDEKSQKFLALNPHSVKNPSLSLLQEHFEPVSGIDDGDSDDMNASESSPSSEDDRKIDDNRIRSKSRLPRLYEVRDERHAEAFLENVSLAKEESLSLGERIASLKKEEGVKDVKFGVGGSREMSFHSRGIPLKNKRVIAEGGGEDERKKSSVASLGLNKSGNRGRRKGNRGNRGGRSRR